MTGIVFNAGERAREELLIPENGEHVWIAAVAYRVSAVNIRKAHRVGENVMLDAENIASISTGCYVCEQPYEERISYRKCPGEPSDDT